VARIFLCHASEDKAQVREVYHQLKALGFEPWLDEVDILPGQNWHYEIEQALETSDFVMVFLSTRSVEKVGYVQSEFRRALYHSEELPEGFIHTIPVKLDDCTIPRRFSRHQWINLSESGAFERIIRALHHGLQQRGQPLPEPFTHDPSFARPETSLRSQLEAGQRIREYILEEKIGAGGAGEVWRAHHQYVGNTVAIKAIYRHASHGSDFQERFLAEASIEAMLAHPHIDSVHDFFFLDDTPYRVTSYFAGGSLADLLTKRGRLPLHEALAISREILEGLNYAHNLGVIHRDVKPSNILVGPDGHVCLGDFGSALLVGTPRQIRIGTLEYMSPEQIQAHVTDRRTDVYSFGCVLYEMLAGQPPFGSQDAGQTEYAIMSGHLQEQPPSLRTLNPEVDEHIEAVVFRALAKAPEHRYRGCQELSQALADIESRKQWQQQRRTQKERILDVPAWVRRKQQQEPSVRARQHPLERPRQRYTKIEFPERCHVNVMAELKIQLTFYKTIYTKIKSLIKILFLKGSQESILSVHVTALAFTVAPSIALMRVPIDQDSDVVVFEVCSGCVR
jgi:serine/threonine protein kinase